MEIDLDKLATISLDYAKGVVSEGHMLKPMLMMLGDDGMIVAVIPDYHENREAAIKVMRGLVAEHQAEVYFFMMEAWLGTGNSTDGSDERLRKPGYLPSKDPQRKECVSIHGVSRSGAETFMFCEIRREGPAISFGDVTKPGGTFIALFGNFFRNEMPN